MGGGVGGGVETQLLPLTRTCRGFRRREQHKGMCVLAAACWGYRVVVTQIVNALQD